MKRRRRVRPLRRWRPREVPGWAALVPVDVDMCAPKSPWSQSKCQAGPASATRLPDRFLRSARGTLTARFFFPGFGFCFSLFLDRFFFFEFDIFPRQVGFRFDFLRLFWHLLDRHDPDLGQVGVDPDQEGGRP
jgi:hypothetical protein